MNKVKQYESAVRLSRKATLDKLEEYLSASGSVIDSRGSNTLVLSGEGNVETCTIHVNPKDSRFSVTHDSGVGNIEISEKKMQILVEGKQACWFLVDVEDIKKVEDGLSFVPNDKQLISVISKVGKVFGG